MIVVEHEVVDTTLLSLFSPVSARSALLSRRRRRVCKNNQEILENVAFLVFCTFRYFLFHRLGMLNLPRNHFRVTLRSRPQTSRIA